MITFRVTAEGNERVARVLRDVADRAPKELAEVVRQWATKTAGPRLARNPYPPHNPGQRYIRTGALGRSWQAGATGSGAKIVNNRPYASYVVGTGQRAGQAWMHVGRWWYGIDIVKEETDQLKEMIADRMKEMLATGAGR